MTSYEDFTSVKVDRPEEGILRIMLDGPNLNAVGPDAHRELADIWPVIGLDQSVRVVVIRGAGDRAFSAGAASISSRP